VRNFLTRRRNNQLIVNNGAQPINVVVKSQPVTLSPNLPENLRKFINTGNTLERTIFNLEIVQLIRNLRDLPPVKVPGKNGKNDWGLNSIVVSFDHLFFGIKEEVQDLKPGQIPVRMVIKLNNIYDWLPETYDTFLRNRKLLKNLVSAPESFPDADGEIARLKPMFFELQEFLKEELKKWNSDQPQETSMIKFADNAKRPLDGATTSLELTPTGTNFKDLPTLRQLKLNLQVLQINDNSQVNNEIKKLFLTLIQALEINSSSETQNYALGILDNCFHNWIKLLKTYQDVVANPTGFIRSEEFIKDADIKFLELKKFLEDKLMELNQAKMFEAEVAALSLVPQQVDSFDSTEKLFQEN